MKRRDAEKTILPPKYGIDVAGLSRKKRRKFERSEKKVRRHAFHMKNKGVIQKEMERICQKLNIATEPRVPHHQAKKTKNEKPKREEATLKQASQRECDKVRRQNLRNDNKKEDKLIKQLEKRLFLAKRKNKNMPKSFIDEGLDYILELVDKKYQDNVAKEDNEDVPAALSSLSQKRKQDETNVSSPLKRCRSASDTDERDAKSSEDEGSNVVQSVAAPKARRGVDRTRVPTQHEETADSSEDWDESSAELDIETDNEDSLAGANKDRKKILNTGTVESDISDSEEEYDDGSDDSSAENCVDAASKTGKHSSGNLPVSSTSDASEDEVSQGGNDLQETEHTRKASAKQGKQAKKVRFSVNEENSEEEGTISAQSSGEEFSEAAAERLKVSNANEDGTWEDIYGRLRDKEGNLVPQRYIPPAKRLQTSELSSKKREELARLKKQLKGLLNRLSEATVQPIGMQVEDLYRKHSNNDMNSVLNMTLCESVISPFPTPERLVMEHAMLVAYLHGNVGTEVGEWTHLNFLDFWNNN